MVLILKCDILSNREPRGFWPIMACTTDSLLCWYIFRDALNLLGYDPKYANKESNNMMTELQGLILSPIFGGLCV